MEAAIAKIAGIAKRRTRERFSKSISSDRLSPDMTSEISSLIFPSSVIFAKKESSSPLTSGAA